ncbi:MAG: hypothetical protein D6739_03010, partial [Nitrospirae bacterium]
MPVRPCSLHLAVAGQGLLAVAPRQVGVAPEELQGGRRLRRDLGLQGAQQLPRQAVVAGREGGAEEAVAVAAQAGPVDPPRLAQVAVLRDGPGGVAFGEGVVQVDQAGEGGDPAVRVGGGDLLGEAEGLQPGAALLQDPQLLVADPRRQAVVGEGGHRPVEVGEGRLQVADGQVEVGGGEEGQG